MIMNLVMIIALLGFLGICTAHGQVFQMDTCNKHRAVSEAAPGMTLTVTKDSICVLTTQVLRSGCIPSKRSAAVVMRFPCKEGPREKLATGPALNIWASFDGVPKPTQHGMIVNEMGPAQRQSIKPSSNIAATAAAATTMNSNNSSTYAMTGAAAGAAGCNLLTLNPGLYFHRNPPVYTYGYVVSGLPCQKAASASAVTSMLESAGATSFATTYSLWLKPAVPAPPKSLSMEQQSCHLVISVLNKSYVSTDRYACSMSELVPEQLADGCCYNGGGGSGGVSTTLGGRRLLSLWDQVWSYARRVQH